MAQAPFETDLDVLNYALTLEHIESAFYREGLEMFDANAYLANGLQTSVRDRIQLIGDQEADHVGYLTSVIEDLGGEPVVEGIYDFGYGDLAGFLQVAGALENTGVAAYQGAAPALMDNDLLLTAALTIHGVEARHAAYLNEINGTNPFPDAVNPSLTPEEVLEIATPFIAG